MKTPLILTFAALLLACGLGEPSPPRSSPVGAVEAVALPAGPLRVHLAAGAAHACLLHDGGRITCWGDNQKGQLGARDEWGGAR